MSAGRFTVVGYTRDTGDIHPIKVQPETIAAVFAPGGANAGEPLTSLTNDIECNARGSKRKNGLRARYVTCKWELNPPAGYTGESFSIPVLAASVFASIQKGGEVQYLGETANVIEKYPESPFNG